MWKPHLSMRISIRIVWVAILHVAIIWKLLTFAIYGGDSGQKKCGTLWIRLDLESRWKGNDLNPISWFTHWHTKSAGLELTLCPAILQYKILCAVEKW